VEPIELRHGSMSVLSYMAALSFFYFSALTIEGSPDAPLQWYDYFFHFLAFFWKIILAFIPPK